MRLLNIKFCLVFSLSFLNTSCGEERIKLNPGPILKDVIDTWEEEKAANHTLRQDAKPLIDDNKEQISLEGSFAQLFQEVDALAGSASEISSGGFSFDIVRNWKSRDDGTPVSALVVRASHFNAEVFEFLIGMHSSLKVRQSQKDGRHIHLDVRLSSDQVSAEESEAEEERNLSLDSPIVLIAEKIISIGDNEILWTDGRELHLIAPKIQVDGTFSTQPSIAPENQPGRDAGDLFIHTVTLNLGPNHEFNLRGGDAGFITAKTWTEEELRDKAEAKAREQFKLYVDNHGWDKLLAEAEWELTDEPISDEILQQAWAEAKSSHEKLKRFSPDIKELRDWLNAVNIAVPKISFNHPANSSRIDLPIYSEFRDLSGGSSGNLVIEEYSGVAEPIVKLQNEIGRHRDSPKKGADSSIIQTYEFDFDISSSYGFVFLVSSTTTQRTREHDNTNTTFHGTFDGYAPVLKSTAIVVEAHFSEIQIIDPPAHESFAASKRGDFVFFSDLSGSFSGREKERFYKLNVGDRFKFPPSLIAARELAESVESKAK